MTSLICLCGAVGVLLFWSGLTPPPRTRRVSTPLAAADRLAAEAGFRRVKGAGLIGLGLAAGASAFILTTGVTGLVALGALMGGAGGWSPFALARVRRERLRRARSNAWPDALAGIIAGVRAGVSLAECCCALADRGPEGLRAGFSAFAATYRASGRFDDGLVRLRDVLQDPVADRTVLVLRMAHQVGGNDLVRVLRTSADLLREDLRIRGEVHARWSWTVTAARVAAAAPPAVLVIMSVRPEAAAVYRTGAGSLTILLGATATLMGYRLMLRAAKLPEDRRVV